jgi:hypothetical protein
MGNYSQTKAGYRESLIRDIAVKRDSLIPLLVGLHVLRNHDRGYFELNFYDYDREKNGLEEFFSVCV